MAAAIVIDCDDPSTGLQGFTHKRPPYD